MDIKLKQLENQGWKFFLLSSGGFGLKAPSRSEACAFRNQYRDWIDVMRRLWGAIWIGSAENNDEIDNISKIEEISFDHLFNRLILPYSQGLDLNEARYYQVPVYLTSMLDQRILWANDVALASNKASRCGQLIGTVSSALWKDKGMIEMLEMLQRDKVVRSFVNVGYQYNRELNNVLVGKREVSTESNYYFIEHQGEICRVCVTLKSQDSSFGS